MVRILIIILFSSASLFAQEEINLEQSIKKTLLNNYSIKLVNQQVKIAENNSGAGNAGMLPVLNANAGYTESTQNSELEFAGGIPNQSNRNARTNNFNANLQLSWTIFDGLAMFSNYDKLEKLKTISQIALQIEMENTIRSLTQTYINALTANSRLRNLRQSLELSRTRLDRVRESQKFGNASNLQVLQAQVDLNTDSIACLESELQYQSLVNTMKFIMGEKTDRKYVLLDDIKIDQELDFVDLKDNTFRLNNSINQALLNKEVSQEDYNIAIAAFMPQVSVNASYGYSRNESEAGFLLLNESWGPNVGANLNWNLFNSFRKNTALQNSKVAIESQEIAIQNIKASIELNLINNWQTYIKRKEILNLTELSVEAAEDNYERTLENFKYGNSNSIELRQAQVNLINTKIALDQAKYNLKLAETELKIISGNLLN